MQVDPHKSIMHRVDDITQRCDHQKEGQNKEPFLAKTQTSPSNYDSPKSGYTCSLKLGIQQQEFGHSFSKSITSTNPSHDSGCTISVS